MRKLPFMLLGICIAACHQAKNTTEKITAGLNPVSQAMLLPAADITSGLQTLLADMPESFTIPRGVIKKVEAKKGLRVTVNADNLETADGQPVSGDIQVSIKEMKKANAMIANNCPTVSDGKLLVSDGAYYIGMSSNGKALHVKKGKSLKVEFPMVNDNGMELFYGERNNDGVMNWKPLNQKLKAKATTDSSSTTTANTSQAGATTNLAAAGMAADARLKLYTDSIMNIRRDYVVCHYKEMTQNQIRKIMEAPFKMAYNDYPKYNFLYNQYFYEMLYNDVRLYTSENCSYYILGEGKDSFSFVRSPIIRHIDKNNIDVAVDSSLLKKYKNKKLVVSKLTVATRYYAPVEIENLGWINCDHYLDAPDGFTPQYTLNIQGAVPDNVGVYLIFRNINSMLQQKIETRGKNVVTLYQNLPLNSQVEFLIYSKVNNQFVECKQTIKVTPNMVLPVTFSPVADTQVKKEFLDYTMN